MDQMNEESIKPDWSEKCWKEMLVFQRKSMWLKDTIGKLAVWMGLKQGMTAIDVGCGLGYLGYTYWRYFGKGGHYIGIDKTPELIENARKSAQNWAIGGRADFRVGDAYKLPFPDDYADWVMCQTLLIHLDDPLKALSEMIRVAKPGGLVMCNEPDNHNPSLGRIYNSVPEQSIGEHLLHVKVHLICHEGRIKLGKGDDSIGPKVPRMMKQVGFLNIEVRMNDHPHYIDPPYEGSLQKDGLENIKKQFLDKERCNTLKAQEREEFLAGGGNPAEYEHYRQIADRYMAVLRKQVEAGEYYACGTSYFYTVTGRKPNL